MAAGEFAQSGLDNLKRLARRRRKKEREGRKEGVFHAFRTPAYRAEQSRCIQVYVVTFRSVELRKVPRTEIHPTSE